jgi:putative hydrolase of the HAD superfamily
MVARMRVSTDNGRISAPDFQHVEAWIFDLDNTLYRADCQLFAQIDARMATFIAGTLQIPEEQAKRVQKDYYRDYGSTLNGLMRRHGVDPEVFLEYAHDIDLEHLKPDPLLNEAITRLPGRRIVFTNGCRNHAQRVLDRLGLADAIPTIWDIRSSNFAPKPDRAAYESMVASMRVAPEKSAMFDDVARNLVPARQLGMTAVWIDDGSIWSGQGPLFPVADAHHIDFATDDLTQFLRSIRI